MINEIKTKELFGYISEDLKKKSHKPIVRICDKCKSEKIMSRKQYRELCISCSHLGIKKSKEHAKNISKGLKGKYIGKLHHNYGKKRSEEIKKKISINHSILSNPKRLPPRAGG